MRELDEPVDVTASDDHRPQSFRWRGHDYEVSEVLHTWTEEEGGWWVFKRPVTRRYFRVQAQGYRRRITAELYISNDDGEAGWKLAAVYE